MALTGTVNMFKAPPSPYGVLQAPVIKGADSFGAYLSGGNFANLTGQKIHLPNTEIIGGVLTYLGREVKLWFAGVVDFTGPSYQISGATILDSTDVRITIGTDGDGNYLEIVSDVAIFAYGAGTETGNASYLAMVYTNDTYATWTNGAASPPAKYGTST